MGFLVGLQPCRFPQPALRVLLILTAIWKVSATRFWGSCIVAWVFHRWRDHSICLFIKGGRNCGKEIIV